MIGRMYRMKPWVMVMLGVVLLLTRVGIIT